MTQKQTVLSLAQIEAELQSLPGWHYRNQALERVWTTPSYLEGARKLMEIAQWAESADHHPALSLDWGQLTIRYHTHSAGGVTGLDVAQARQIEVLLEPQAQPFVRDF